MAAAISSVVKPRPVLARSFWVRLHRYAGLSLAAVLCLLGITGSIIAFHDELDRLLNEGVLTVDDPGTAVPLAQLIASVEAAYPRARVDLVIVPEEPTHAVEAYLTPRIDPETQQPFALDVTQAFAHPRTGEVLGARAKGTFRADRLHLMPFVYSLHYTLGFGPTGMFFLGLIGLLWLFDCLVALYLAWPKSTWRAVREALWVKWSSSRARVTYDLHRAGGLWIWLVLVVIAFSGVSICLHSELFVPALNAVAPVTKEPYDYLPRREQAEAPLPVALDAALGIADAALEQAGVDGRFGGVWIERTQGFYAVRYHTDLDIMREHAGTFVYVSALSGEVLAVRLPSGPTVGDAIRDWQFPLHSGKAFGLGGRIAVSAIGLLVAMLSVTGVLIWWKKHRASSGRWRRR